MHTSNSSPARSSGSRALRKALPFLLLLPLLSADGACASGTQDYGSGGDATQNGPKAIILQPGETLALPFSVVPGNYYGNVGIVPHPTPFPEDGSQVRIWLSATADGPALSQRQCSKNVGQEGALNWDQTGKTDWKCQIPNEKAQLFLNLKLCISDRLDRSCNGPNVTYGTESARVYLSGSKYN